MSEHDHNIHLVCANCSERFGVLHELAGHQAVCPHCGQQILVPDQVSSRGDASGEETVQVLKNELHTHRHCPVCENPVGEADRVCVNCGYDLVDGHHIHTDIKEDQPGRGLLRRLVTAGAIAILAYALYRVILHYV